MKGSKATASGPSETPGCPGVFALSVSSRVRQESACARAAMNASEARTSSAAWVAVVRSMRR